MDAHLHRPALRGAVPHLLPQGHAGQADRAPDRSHSRLNAAILIATYGDKYWESLASDRALPSAVAQDVPVFARHDDSADSIAPVRNALVEEVTQDWLLFLDADDELAPGYLDAMRRAYERESRAPSAPLLLTPAVQRIEKGRKRPPFFYPEVPLDQANWLVVGTLLEKDLFERAGGFCDYPHGFEDASLWYKANHLGARVVKVPNAVYIQHVNPQSKHRQGWRNRKWQVETHQRVYRELDEWAAAQA